MRAVDAWAIEEQGVPQDDLMARAALGLARGTAAVAGEGPIRIVAGKGNNGGDGRVAARLLMEDGHEVEVIDGTEPFDPERLGGAGGAGAVGRARPRGGGWGGRGASRSRPRSGRSTSRPRPSWPATCRP